MSDAYGSCGAVGVIAFDAVDVSCGLEAGGYQWLLQGSPMEELYLLKHPIDRARMKMHMRVQAGAEAVDESDCAYVKRRLQVSATGKVGDCVPSEASLKDCFEAEKLNQLIGK